MGNSPTQWLVSPSGQPQPNAPCSEPWPPNQRVAKSQRDACGNHQAAKEQGVLAPKHSSLFLQGRAGDSVSGRCPARRGRKHMVSRPIPTPGILPRNNPITWGLLDGPETDCFFDFSTCSFYMLPKFSPLKGLCVCGGYLSFLFFFFFFQSSMQNPRETL